MHTLLQAFWQGARVRDRTIQSKPHNFWYTCHWTDSGSKHDEEMYCSTDMAANLSEHDIFVKANAPICELTIFVDTNFGQSCSKIEIWFVFNCQTKRTIFIYPEIPPCWVFFWAQWSNICLFAQSRTICLPKPAQFSFFSRTLSEGLLLCPILFSLFTLMLDSPLLMEASINILTAAQKPIHGRTLVI